jgi:hypothetical protein
MYIAAQDDFISIVIMQVHINVSNFGRLRSYRRKKLRVEVRITENKWIKIKNKQNT